MKSIRLFTAAAFACTLAACFSSWQGNEATLTLRIGNDASGSRAIADYPPGGATMALLEHEIQLKGPGGSKTLNIQGDTQVSTAVAPGHWNISVKSYLGSDLFAEGFASKDILSGQVNSVEVTMHWGGAELTLVMAILPEGDENLAMLSHRISIANASSGTERSMEALGAEPVTIPVIFGDLAVVVASSLDGIPYARGVESVSIAAREKKEVPISLCRLFTVTYEANNDTPVQEQKIPYGAHAFPPDAPELSGHAFAGWYKDNETFNEPWYFENDAVTGNITLYAKWNITVLTGDITIELWFNEDDGNIVASETDVIIFKNKTPKSFTAKVNDGYTDIQWLLWEIPVSGSAGKDTITINAADYNTGTYQLLVIVFKDGVPYSAEISFTVKSEII